MIDNPTRSKDRSRIWPVSQKAKRRRPRVASVGFRLGVAWASRLLRSSRRLGANATRYSPPSISGASIGASNRSSSAGVGLRMESTVNTAGQAGNLRADLDRGDMGRRHATGKICHLAEALTGSAQAERLSQIRPLASGSASAGSSIPSRERAGWRRRPLRQKAWTAKYAYEMAMYFPGDSPDPCV